MKNSIWQSTRVILFLAFGGLLLLIAIFGFVAYRRSDRIYRDVISIQNAYRQRAAVINKFQSEIDISAILVRDYLMDPAVARGVEYRQQLLDIRQSQEEHLRVLKRISTPNEQDSVQQLARELKGYWDILDPLFAWTPEIKAAISFSFLRKQVLPRRTALLDIMDKINELDSAGLTHGQERIAESWKSYLYYLKLLFACTLTLALAGAAISIYRLSTLEKRAQEHRKRLAEAELRLRWLTQRLIHAQEEERKTLSRELHDEIGQMLTGIRMVFGNLEQLRSGPESEFKNQVSEGKGLAEQTLQMVRNLALGLRPSMLDDLGLEPALEWLAREFSRRSGIPVEFKTDGSLKNIPEEIRTCIYRVVQESLTNCARHSWAKTVRINVHGGFTEVSLTVRDDGAGFDPAQTHNRGLGLIGIHERISELGGAVAVDSQPGKGTVLKAAIPLRTEDSI